MEPIFIRFFILPFHKNGRCKRDRKKQGIREEMCAISKYWISCGSVCFGTHLSIWPWILLLYPLRNCEFEKPTGIAKQDKICDLVSSCIVLYFIDNLLNKICKLVNSFLQERGIIKPTFLFSLYFYGIPFAIFLYLSTSLKLLILCYKEIKSAINFSLPCLWSGAHMQKKLLHSQVQGVRGCAQVSWEFSTVLVNLWVYYMAYPKISMVE